MTNNVSAKLKESRSHAVLDVSVTILGKEHSLSQAFTYANRTKADDVVSQLEEASSRITLEKNDYRILIRTAVNNTKSVLFSIENDEHASGLIFEHVESLTNLRGLKLV